MALKSEGIELAVALSHGIYRGEMPGARDSKEESCDFQKFSETYALSPWLSC
jgi:hypothetical protein